MLGGIRMWRKSGREQAHSDCCRACLNFAQTTDNGFIGSYLGRGPMDIKTIIVSFIGGGFAGSRSYVCYARTAQANHRRLKVPHQRNHQGVQLVLHR